MNRYLLGILCDRGLQELAAKIPLDERIVIYWEWNNFWARKHSKVLKRASENKLHQFEQRMVEDLKRRLLKAL